MSDEPLLPQTGDEQDIGNDAATCFRARKPQDWRLTDLAGTEDYGFDYQVQTTPGQRATDVFRVQLKGTRSPNLSADGTFLSIQIKASTARYYSRLAEPVLLVLCDLTQDDDPVDCPLHYVWIPEELRRINFSSKSPGQGKVTLRVPVADRLTRRTDISEYVRHANATGQAGQQFDLTVAAAKPDLMPSERLEVARDVQAGIAAGGADLLDALSDMDGKAWVEPLQGTLPWHLRDADRHAKAGRATKALAALKHAETQLGGSATDGQRAAYWFIEGRAQALLGNKIAASDSYLRAAEIGGASKHWVAWAETAIQMRFAAGAANDFSDVLARLPGSEPTVVAMRARLMAAQGDYDEAAALAATVPGSEGKVVLVIIHTMRGQAAEALKLALEGLEDRDAGESNRHLYVLMKARARFNLAVGPSMSSGADEDFHPPSGAPGMDIELLKQAWIDIQEAVELLKEGGWPPNVELMSDIWAAAASMLGRQRETLPDIAAAAKARPHLAILQSNAEMIAHQCGEVSIALEINARQAGDASATLKRISQLHEDRRHPDCVALFESALPSLDHKHPLFGHVLAGACLSAHLVARPDLVAKWRAILEAEPNLAPCLALADFFMDLSANQLGHAEAVKRLDAEYERLGRPLAIAATLFMHLDPRDPEQAKRCEQIGDDMLQVRLLAPEAAVHMSMALVTQTKWDKLLVVARAASGQFESPRLNALVALALDKQGDTEGARALLHGMVEEGVADGVALDTYASIMIRCGFVPEAIAAAERLLQGATKPATKMSCLRMLFALVRTADPASPRLLDLTLKMGALVDQKNESEEGGYLSMFILATAAESVVVPPRVVAEATARAAAFFEAFPDSRILKRAEYREDSSAEEFMEAMWKATGSTQAQRMARVKMENELQSGEAVVPFAWRPRQALVNVRDVVELWETCKRSRPEDRKYHLQMMLAEWTPKAADSLRGKKPLIDLVALLVLLDLDLLPRLFAYFPKVAIAQGTLFELARLSDSWLGSIWGQKCKRLQDALKPYLPQIEQPRGPADEFELGDMRHTTSELQELSKNPDYELYSDDGLFRLFCSADGAGGAAFGMSTIDLMLGLEESGAMSVEETALHIARLSSWNVGLHVLARHQFALIPATAITAESIFEGVSALQADETFSGLFKSLWDPEADFSKVAGHAAAILREMLVESRFPVVAIASVIGVWFVKAKLRRDSDAQPLDIIAGVTLLAASQGPPLDAELVKQLWSVFYLLVELEFGSRMDEQKEKEALRNIARMCAIADAGMSGQIIKDRMSSGLVSGTAPADEFSSAYSMERVRLGVKIEEKK